MTMKAKKNIISSTFGTVFFSGVSVSISILNCLNFDFSRYELFHRFL